MFRRRKHAHHSAHANHAHDAHAKKTRKRQFSFMWKAGLILSGIFLFIVGSGLLWIALTPTPDITSFANREVSQSTKVYDRTGQVLLYDFGSSDVRRESVPLADVSPYIINATISIEDSDFYSHSGIRVIAILRAILADIIPGGATEGGSTITQQVIKNSILTSQRTITRKVHEWVLAVKLEEKYSKQQILEFYFNETPYGGTIYGVETASETFFGIPASQVDLAQAAYLAALPQAPTFYSPYGANRAALDARKNLVLSRMQQLGYITKDQEQQARSEVVTFKPAASSSIIAPHFVFYIQQYLENKYGAGILNQGLKVVTTLDAELQAKAETTVNTYALSNTKKFNASNAALVAIDPKTGQILAMVGSRDYFDTQIDGQFNAALAYRQPGSAFKPFVYSAALLKGYAPNTEVFDLPTQFSTACSPTDNTNDTAPCYSPSDYDGKFRGPMTFTTALAQSINVPAVKAIYLAGIPNTISLATRMGITGLTQNQSQYGLSLALGAGEVRLLDLTSAYAAFADDGIRNPVTGILSVTQPDGTVLEQYSAQPSQVLDPNVAREMTSMLSNNAARYPEYPPENPLHFDTYDVAAKTGTTNDYRDAWTVGYSPNITVGVWAGNNDNAPMVKEIAGYIVAPMWHDFMGYALTKVPVGYFTPPSIASSTSPALQGSYDNMTANGTYQIHEILYWVDRNNPLGPPPSNPANDPQYSYWEYPVQVWAASHGAGGGQ